MLFALELLLIPAPAPKNLFHRSQERGQASGAVPVPAQAKGGFDEMFNEDDKVERRLQFHFYSTNAGA